MKEILDTLNNYSNLISLLLSAVAIFIAIASLLRTRQSEKAMVKKEILEKKAELYSINEVYFNGITSHTYLPGREEMEVRVKCLQKQIEYLSNCKN